MEDYKEVSNFEEYELNNSYFHEHYLDMILNMAKKQKYSELKDMMGEEPYYKLKDGLGITNVNIEILEEIKRRKSKKVRKELIKLRHDIFSLLSSMINVSERVQFMRNRTGKYDPENFQERTRLSNPHDLVDDLYTIIREIDLLIDSADTFYNLKKMENFIDVERSRMETKKEHFFFPNVFKEQNEILKALVKNGYITEEEINSRLRKIDSSKYIKIKLPNNDKTYIKYHDGETLIYRESDDRSIGTIHYFSTYLEKLCYKYKEILEEFNNRLLDN